MVKQFLACVTIGACAALTPPAGVADPLAHTFSIVAPDASGEIGVAVQSHWFSVGSLVKGVFATEPAWMELVAPLPAAGLLPDDPALVARIQAPGRSRAPRRR